MRSALVLALVVPAACRSGDRRAAGPPPETSTGPGAAGLLACQAVVRAMDAVVACAPEGDERFVTEHTLSSSRALFTATKPLETDFERRATVQFCLEQLAMMQFELEGKKCTSPVGARERAWIDALRRHRTVVPADAKGDDRAALAELAARRDRACACKTEACFEAIDAELEASLKPLSQDAGTALRDAAGEMIDELMRCGRFMRLELHRDDPQPPPDPRAIKELADRIRAERSAGPKPPLAPVTLPGGKVLTGKACEAMKDEFERESCLMVLEDVASCGQSAECRDETIAEYLELISDEDGEADGEGDDEDEEQP